MDALGLQDSVDDPDGAHGPAPRRKASPNGGEDVHSNPQPSRMRAFARLNSDISLPDPLSDGPPVNGALNEMDTTGTAGPRKEPTWMEMEAGPSDYWRRSPSPPTPVAAPAIWRELSTGPWPEDLEDGPSDFWSARRIAGGPRHSAEGTNGHGEDMPFRPFAGESQSNGHRQFDDSVEEIEEELGILPREMRSAESPILGESKLILQEEDAPLGGSRNGRHRKVPDSREEVVESRESIADDEGSLTFELPQQVGFGLGPE